MADLFESKKKTIRSHTPLAVRMRPRDLNEFVGQTHILGKGKLLRRAIDADRISSLILYGPPGTGKTALAYIIANITKAYFHEINAVLSNVQELREALKSSKEREKANGRRSILFVDEIHRFNKAQQDVLMPDVESGNPILIGATTHNPFFSLVSPLISRSIVFELRRLSKEEIVTILKNALKDQDRGFGNVAVRSEEKVLLFLADASDGDARKALSALEIGVLTTKPGKDKVIDLDIKVAEESIQKKALVYDKGEDAHYDTISAFIKSMRGSDPDAALYWLGKMLYAGEDPRFIARRIVICAAEDVGNADPQALVVANAAFQVADFVGMPEARIPLAQAVTYIACAPKSNAAYLGINKAMADVEKGRSLEVPTYLKDASYPGAKKLGRGEGYKYAHQYKDHYVKQDYIPEEKRYYEPTDIGYEKIIKEYLERLRNKG
ncbi:MAG: replication-associated recombination protein A [Candidatus Omnitrophota bacterium]|nr:replication-associated recombination protein A [Candidatus Omnitrophota bacterium]